jgi:hypothetical protein
MFPSDDIEKKIGINQFLLILTGDKLQKFETGLYFEQKIILMIRMTLERLDR